LWRRSAGEKGTMCGEARTEERTGGVMRERDGRDGRHGRERRPGR
jgi:hypothetical protein